MRVVIIGGGIAGPATALALHAVGIEATVHEAHPRTDDDIGAFLTLATNGMAALARIGMAEAVAAAGYPLTHLRLLDADGAVTGVRPLDGHDDPLTCFRCLRRAELAAVLRDAACERGIAVEHGRRLTGWAETDEGVTAGFAGGATATGDLLVGADGLRSVTRSVIDPGGPAPRYVGQQVYFGYTPAAAADPGTPPAHLDMIRGRAVFVGCTPSPTGDLSWFARTVGPRLDQAVRSGDDPEPRRAALLDGLRSDRSAAAAVVAGAERIMATDTWDLGDGLGRPWRTRRAVIIGDAAHAASPATGQGASMALADAVALAGALRDRPGLDAALGAYEAERRGPTEANLVASAELSAGRAPSPR